MIPGSFSAKHIFRRLIFGHFFACPRHKRLCTEGELEGLQVWPSDGPPVFWMKQDGVGSNPGGFRSIPSSIISSARVSCEWTLSWTPIVLTKNEIQNWTWSPRWTQRLDIMDNEQSFKDNGQLTILWQNSYRLLALIPTTMNRWTHHLSPLQISGPQLSEKKNSSPFTTTLGGKGRCHHQEQPSGQCHQLQGT